MKLALIHRVRVGNRLYLFDEESRERMERQIDRFMRATGHAREHPDGSKSWYVDEAVADLSKSGSAVFTWRGDKVLHQRFLVTSAKDGTVTRKEIGKTFRELD